MASLAGQVAGLTLGKIDPAAETAAYQAEVMAAQGAAMDEASRALLAEDLRSPCAEEIAVFRAFAREVGQGTKRFVVLDTAPTGHTLLLLDASEAYQRELEGQARSSQPEEVLRLLERLRDPAYTRMVLVTLPEATPVHEAAELQDDLRRAQIEPFAWIINQSLLHSGSCDPFIWLMILPMMLKIDFGALRGVLKKPKGLCVTLVVNWLVKPFSMALLGWFFIQWLFSDLLGWIEPDPARTYTAGRIILAAAPCTAMVFVWSYLTDGDGPYTRAQVAINDLIMVFAFAPIVAILIGVSGVAMPGGVLVTAVVVVIVIPLVAGCLSRAALIRSHGVEWLERRFPPLLRSVMIVALLATLVLIFAFQAENITTHWTAVLLLAVPILIQVYFDSGLTYWLMRRLQVPHNIAAAVAITWFGPTSPAALAGLLEHSQQRGLGAGAGGFVQLHSGGEVGEAVAELLEGVELHVTAVRTGAAVGGAGDEVFVGALLAQAVQHAAFGDDDDVLDRGGFAVADHFFRGANLVGQQADRVGAFRVGDDEGGGKLRLDAVDGVAGELDMHIA
jgi:ACR3 family arsenite transporter